MVALGLVDEVRTLRERGLESGRTASRALGYQQVLAYLGGTCQLEQACAETVRATRRFARRQRSWFRRDPRIVWLRNDQAVGAAGTPDGDNITRRAMAVVRDALEAVR